LLCSFSVWLVAFLRGGVVAAAFGSFLLSGWLVGWFVGLVGVCAGVLAV
jgi:hypothetical protein